MATERIDIVISERGSRVVQRNIRDIGTSARESSSGVDLLKSVLATIGIAAGLREVLRVIDAYTSLQNRLRSTGLEGQNLTGVYRALLQASNETRSSVQGSVELYSRLAVSSKELGVSQQQLIDFTKSLNQAIILSGASAIESENALVQLSQGMASGALRGDELRSVMEQLPAVADVIAKQLGVTRGQLRKMGEDGKITADIILAAFQSARGELEQRFARTVPTIGQSFQILKNRVVDFFGELDKKYQIADRLSKAILFVADNLDTMAAAVATAAKVTATATVAYYAYEAALKGAAIASAIKQFIDYRLAIANGTVVVLGSAEAERQRAAAVLASATAQEAATVAKVQASIIEARGNVAVTESKLAEIAATQAAIVASREEALAKLAASNASIVQAQRTIAATEAAGALSYALALNKAATLDLAAAEAARSAALSSLAVLGQQQARVAILNTEALAAQTVAQNALTAAQVRGAEAAGAAAATTAAASAASVRATAAAAGSTTLLGQAMLGLRTAAASLWAVLVANPITAIVIALATVVTGLIAFRDQIKLGTNETTTLGDLFRAVAEVITAAMKQIWDAARALFTPLIALLEQWVGEIDISIAGILRLVAKAADFYQGAWFGAVAATIVYFRGFGPAVKDIVTQALNGVLRQISSFVNAAGDLLSPLSELAGLGKIEAIDLTLSNENEGAAKRLGQDVSAAFNAGFNVDISQKALQKLFDRADEIGRERAAKEAEAAAGGTVSSVAPPKVNLPDLDKDKDKKKKVRDLAEELKNLISQYDRVYAAQQQYAEALEILNKAEAAGLVSAARKAEVLGMIKEQLKDQLDPLGAVNRELDEQQKLLKLTSDAREIEAQMMAIEKDLRSQGVALGEVELRQLRERLTLIQAETKAAEARQQVYDAIRGPQEKFKLDIAAINELLAAGTITQTEANAYLVQSQSDLLAGTTEHQAALVAIYEQTYARIEELRKADLISEQTAAMLKRRADLEQTEGRLANTRTFFATLSGLSRSENRKLAAVGKAAAIAQATIDGVLAVQKALASSPPPANYVLAAATGAVAAVNVAQIISQPLPGYAFGGDFKVGGVGGTDSQTVAFRATPGERVRVSTPEQDRAEERKQNAGGGTGGNGLRVFNVLDPSLLRDYLDSPDGDEVFVNAISRNSGRIAPILNTGKS